jgi:hypothetical protein
MALAAESVHGVTCVAPFILPADVVDQRFGALHLHFEGGNQRIFRVYDDVARLPLYLKTDGKLQLRFPFSSLRPLVHCSCNHRNDSTFRSRFEGFRSHRGLLCGRD